MLKINNLHAKVEDKEILKGVDLDIKGIVIDRLDCQLTLGPLLYSQVLKIVIPSLELAGDLSGSTFGITSNFPATVVQTCILLHQIPTCRSYCEQARFGRIGTIGHLYETLDCEAAWESVFAYPCVQ